MGWARAARLLTPRVGLCPLPPPAINALPCCAPTHLCAGADPEANEIFAVKTFPGHNLAQAREAQLREAAIVTRDHQHTSFVALRGAYLGSERERRAPALVYDLANGSSLDKAAR